MCAARKAAKSNMKTAISYKSKMKKTGCHKVKPRQGRGKYANSFNFLFYICDGISIFSSKCTEQVQETGEEIIYRNV